jgi:hypothetical protein
MRTNNKKTLLDWLHETYPEGCGRQEADEMFRLLLKDVYGLPYAERCEIPDDDEPSTRLQLIRNKRLIGEFTFNVKFITLRLRQLVSDTFTDTQARKANRDWLYFRDRNKKWLVVRRSEATLEDLKQHVEQGVMRRLISKLKAKQLLLDHAQRNPQDVNEIGQLLEQLIA